MGYGIIMYVYYKFRCFAKPNSIEPLDVAILASNYEIAKVKLFKIVKGRDTFTLLESHSSDIHHIILKENEEII